MDKYTVGQKIIINLNTTDIYEGIFVNGGPDYIVLADICDRNTGNQIGTLRFYKMEIKSISTLDYEGNDDEDQLIKDTSASSTTGANNSLLITLCEYERLKDLTERHVYMATMDNMYHKAVDILNDSETVGLACLGIMKRTSRFDLIILAHWNDLYIFDLLLFNKSEIPDDLRNILESPHITKVVHDSRPVLDILYHTYKIKLKNVFDTQVADILLKQRDKEDLPPQVENLSQCLVSRLNFPKDLLQRALQIQEKEWAKRPLSNSKKIYAAQLVTYLITLKNFLQKSLLKDFHKAVHEYSRSTINKTPIEANLMFHASKTADRFASISIK